MSRWRATVSQLWFCLDSFQSTRWCSQMLVKRRVVVAEQNKLEAVIAIRWTSEDLHSWRSVSESEQHWKHERLHCYCFDHLADISFPYYHNRRYSSQISLILRVDFSMWFWAWIATITLVLCFFTQRMRKEPSTFSRIARYCHQSWPQIICKMLCFPASFLVLKFSIKQSLCSPRTFCNLLLAVDRLVGYSKLLSLLIPNSITQK